MKKKEENTEKTNRRNFLKQGLLLGGGAILGGKVHNNLAPDNEERGNLKALTSDGKLIMVDRSGIKHSKSESSENAKELRKGVPGRKFVMVIDLSKCKQERQCQKACRKMHNLPEDVNWLKVYKMQDSETTAPYWMPSPCYHCDNPPCVKVCPVDATFIREDGVVLIDNQRCIGCRFCMAGCPYSARTFNWKKPAMPEGVPKDQKTCDTHDGRLMGTVDKCDFCVSELAKGEFPKCVSSCPNGVFYMGDLNEDTVSNLNETLRFSELMKSKAGYRFMEELGTKPSVYYLPPASRMFPFKDEDS